MIKLIDHVALDQYGHNTWRRVARRRSINGHLGKESIDLHWLLVKKMMMHNLDDNLCNHFDEDHSYNGSGSRIRWFVVDLGLPALTSPAEGGSIS